MHPCAQTDDAIRLSKVFPLLRSFRARLHEMYRHTVTMYFPHKVCSSGSTAGYFQQPAVEFFLPFRACPHETFRAISINIIFAHKVHLCAQHPCDVCHAERFFSLFDAQPRACRHGNKIPTTRASTPVSHDCFTGKFLLRAQGARVRSHTPTAFPAVQCFIFL